MSEPTATIELSASADYGLSGQYIAHLTGRNPKFTFQREFVGRKGGKRNESSFATVDEPGAYECCNIAKNGKASRFYFVGQIGDGLVRIRADKEDAMVVCKAIDQGRKFGEIVAVSVNTDETSKVQHPYVYEILTAKEAEKTAAAGDMDGAFAACVEALTALPEKQLKQVLSRVKAHFAPKKETASETPESSTT